MGLVGEVLVVDADAALGGTDHGAEPLKVAQPEAGDVDAREDATVSNVELVQHFVRAGLQCRVAGGLASVEDALAWLDRGVDKVVFGRALVVGVQQRDDVEVRAEVLAELPRDRVVAALCMDSTSEEDAARVLKAIEELAPVTAEFLVTFSDRQGRNTDSELPLGLLERLAAAGKETGCTVVVAGGIASVASAVAVEKLGLVPQVGTALQRGTFSLGQLVASIAVTDRADGLYTTIVVDEQGVALGLVYSNEESLTVAMDEQKGVYWSRRRGLWRKGLTSGATQDLLGVSLDCDRDAIRFVVRQHGAGFCHLERRSCWSNDAGIGKLFRTLESRRDNPQPKSYTNRLLRDPELLAAKLREEAQELVDADNHEHVAAEAADVVYFTAVHCVRAGVSWREVETNLERRSKRVRRRKGDAKPAFIKPAKEE